MKRRIHATAASVAVLTIVTFLSATLTSELFLDARAVAMVKRGIVYGLFLLIPAIAITGASGFALAAARTGEQIPAKKKRMPFLALNGLLILLPAALYLDAKAADAQFDTAFYAVQVAEVAFGALQLRWILKSFMAGRRIVASA